MFDGTWGTTYVPKEPKHYPWEQVFAWLPVEVHGKRKWMIRVWRRQIEMYGDAKNEPPMYEYGTLFDVIKAKE